MIIKGQKVTANSAAIFPKLPCTMGDYRLLHLLGTHAYSDFYVARQSHVERRVVLEVLRPAEGDPGRAPLFLNHARSRVAADLPHVVQVLESATSPEGYCYISQPLPNGHCLATMAVDGRKLDVQQACRLIVEVAELYKACTKEELGAAPLGADMIFTAKAGEFSFLSPVLSSLPAEGDSAAQMRALADALEPLLPAEAPGLGRITTLLSWMREGYEGQMLDWEAIGTTAHTIAEQLRPDRNLHVTRPLGYDQGREERAAARRRRQKLRRRILAGVAAFTIVAMGVSGIFLAPGAPEPLPPVRGKYAYCKEKGETVRVLARPVSIAEYAKFLETYPTHDNARRGSITLNISPEESEPTPADWQAMLAAAQNGGEWMGHQLSLDSPVTNVSFWQALMYARFQRAKLPTAPLLRDVRAEAGQPGIEEWTLDKAPATPPYAESSIVLPSEPGANPIPESSPAACSPKRGFRICL